MPEENYSGKVVAVMGGTAGIGRATADAFAQRGAAVGVAAREPERLDRMAEQYRSLGRKISTCAADVSDPGAVDAAASQFESELGPIDIWINNAMTTVYASFHEMTPEEFRRVTEVTYLGFVYGTMAALKRMLPRNRGAIVQVGSTLAYRSIPLQSAYCGAKHAIVGFTDSIRSELIHQESRIRLTVVHMPSVNTPQFDWCLTRMPHKSQPVPPVYQPEVAADSILWALEHDRREVYVSPSIFKAIWGDLAVPGFVDRLLAKQGYQMQQRQEARDPEQPVNLFEPVKGDIGAHGNFDGMAGGIDWKVKLIRQLPSPPQALLIAALLLGAAAAALLEAIF